MGVDKLAKWIWSHKIEAIQKRLKDKQVWLHTSSLSLDDYLRRANKIASAYLKGNNGVKPSCVSYSSYTYAAFLLLTETNSKHDLEECVRCAGGFYVTDRAIKSYSALEEAGAHLWLEKKQGDSWEVFEAVPHMRSTPANYTTGRTIQITHKSITITYDGLNDFIAVMYAGLRR
jgi:hypothetical protein